MDANGQATNLTAKNTIFGKTYNPEKAKGVRTSGTMTFDGCLRTSDCLFSGGNDIKDLVASDLSSADVFKDPENHDFTLKISDKVGDPRWYVSTGINNAKVEAEAGAVYNLAGQKVDAQYKGVVIKNGQKLIQK